MKEIGKVVKVDRDFAVIELSLKRKASDSCKGCQGHNLCGLTQDKRRIKVLKTKDVKIGDLVEIKRSQTLSLKISFFVYIAPLIMFTLGAMIAIILNRSQNIQLLFGGAFFVFSYLILYFLNKRMKYSDKYLPRIERIE